MKDIDLSKIFSSMKENDISELVIKEGSKVYEVRRGGFKQNIVASQGQPVVQNIPSVGHSAQVLSQAVHSAPAESKAGDSKSGGSAKRSDLHDIKSPLVGTFYASPKPESPAFVEVGSKVKKGQTLCIVEAMKNFNEIECEVDGVVEEICTKNGDLVEFGKVLFRIKLG